MFTDHGGKRKQLTVLRINEKPLKNTYKQREGGIVSRLLIKEK